LLLKVDLTGFQSCASACLPELEIFLFSQLKYLTALTALSALHLAHLDCCVAADAGPLAALEGVPALKDLGLTGGFAVDAAKPFQKHLTFGAPDAAIQVSSAASDELG